MKQKKIIALICIVAVLAVGIGAYAAANYGSQEDPLVAKSYIDEVVLPELEEMMDAQLDEAISAMNEKAQTNGEFITINLTGGQKLSCTAGTEILVRSAGAKALGNLANTTDGTAVSNDGKLASNNLYIAAEAGSGVVATQNVTVMVNGSYTIG